MTTTQKNLRLSPASLQQLDALKGWGFGGDSAVMRTALDRMYQTESARRGEEAGMNSQQKYERACQRVRNNPQLSKHERTIIADWSEGDEHWAWVAVAPVKEIVDWAETVEKQ